MRLSAGAGTSKRRRRRRRRRRAWPRELKQPRRTRRGPPHALRLEQRAEGEDGAELEARAGRPPAGRGKEEFEEQEGKRLRGPLLCSEQFAHNEKLVSEVGIGNNMVSIHHTVIIEDESQKALEKGEDIAKEEEQNVHCYTGKQPELLAPQPSVLDSHQLSFTNIGRHLPTHFSDMNTDPPAPDPELNQDVTGQPKSQGQADKDAMKNQSILATGSLKASPSALGDLHQPEQIQGMNQNLSLGHVTRRSARCATVNCTGLQSYRLSSLQVSKSEPDSTKEKESSPEPPEEPAPPARKKTRTFYSAEQLDELERMFQEDHYPDNEKRREIAATVGVTPQRVMNRRAKWRKIEKLTVKENKKCSAAASTLSVVPQQSSQGAMLQTVPQLSDPMNDQPATLMVGTATVNYSSILTGQPASLVSTSVASVTGRTTPYESVQTKPVPQGTFSSLKEEIFPGIPSPPPIRRASLPLNVAINQNNPIVPLMLDSPSSEYSPASQESSSSDTFTYSIQSQSVNSPVQCSYSEQLEPTANLETPYYPPVTQPGAHPFKQYPQHQMSQLQHFPVHLTGNLLPSVHFTPAAPNKSTTAFLSLPGTGGLVTYGTGEAPQRYLQNPIGGQILIQPAASSSGYIPAFQALPWNEFYVQGAPVATQLCSQVPLSSSEAGCYSAEQPQYVHSQSVQPSSCLLQLPKAALPGSALLFSAKQMATAAQDSSPDHQSQPEPMTTLEGASGADNIPRDDENIADFPEDSKN
ncbi:homeobox protein NOBOX isoform X2 [Pogona vitticeps]